MDKMFWCVVDVTLDGIGLAFGILAISGIIPIWVGIASVAISLHRLIRNIKKK